MPEQLRLDHAEFESRAVSMFHEMGAYEALWAEPGSTFKSLSAQFARHPGKLPSDFVSADRAQECAEIVRTRFRRAGVERFGVRVHGAAEYPNKLRDADHPIEFLYFQGWWDLVESRSVAVVGTRTPSPGGLARTRRRVRELVKHDFTVVSGLAAGIDRMAHETAIALGGRTIAVVGTPLCYTYPKENADLQNLIGEKYLTISHIPVIRYEAQDYRRNRLFFPQRNITMSALTEATIIVEAGERSGTLIQARAALAQGRKLFILDNCFRNPRLNWPSQYAEKGAVRVKEFNDVKRHLAAEIH